MVVLLLCTIVTAITQVLMSATFTRSRNLKAGLTDLITQIHARKLGSRAEYLAERCLRHPMVARDDAFLGRFTTPWLNSWRARSGRLPLPNVNPSNVVQREELILMLLEWAAEDGPLSRQDSELRRGELAGLRQALRDALADVGVGNPAHTLREIRAKILAGEMEHPEQSAALNRAQAVLAAAPTDFVARIYTWFDNTMVRNREHFALLAKIWACVVAFVVVLFVQIDSIDVLKRLAVDDRLRANLVEEAQIQTARLEKAEADKQVQGREAEAQQVIADAGAEREEIARSLSDLRNRNVIPSYLLFQQVMHGTICGDGLTAGAFDGSVTVGTDRRVFKADLRAGQEINDLAAGIRKSGVNAAVYTVDQRASRQAPARKCAVVVAGDPGIQFIDVSQGTTPLKVDLSPGYDTLGLGTRKWGILLSWILVSLGAPFWFDLLKQLLGLRTLIAKKDDDERRQREAQHTTPQPTPVQPQTATQTAASTGDDERGDLAATGAEG